MPGLASLAGREDLNAPFIAERTQIDQDAIGHQHSTYFTQGMDHALMVNSSERPGKDGDVERLFLERQVFRLGCGKGDFAGQVTRAVG